MSIFILNQLSLYMSDIDWFLDCLRFSLLLRQLHLCDSNCYIIWLATSVVVE